MGRGVKKFAKNLPFARIPFSPLYQGNNFLWLPVCFPRWRNRSRMESTFKGKNLLLWGQILSHDS